MPIISPIIKDPMRDSGLEEKAPGKLEITTGVVIIKPEIFG